MSEPAPEKLEKLRQALEAYESGAAGGGLFDVQEEEAKAKVRSRALLLLDQRARSRSELHDRLVRAEFDPEVIESVLDDLANVGLLDDAAFAREWVRQRHARRGKSAWVLDRELQRKGVAQVDRAEALEQVTQESEQSIMEDLAAKKARSVKTIPEDRAERDKVLRRIVGVLARRGFNEGASLRVAKAALEARCAELENE
ncbi:regulatory protein RecX [Corynebacterium sp. CMW7794]|uniref:recombination regulator RecX n=1 Tax=Corynebacterium TaxID=1716 RepID=UPI00079BCFFB|nr:MULTISPECIES: recombination regulator RecX [Corynebacterium]KXI19252.1 regulatory protein RecX [Corynebacterium sp. CMW7794]MBF9012296.1 recombination regulator RecX [Corynebacterium phoceense]